MLADGRRPDPDTADLRALLAGTAGWWASARLTVLAGDRLLLAGAAHVLLRRPLMGVPAGVRVEDAAGAVLAQVLGAPVDEDGSPVDPGTGVRAALDPLALATGLPPAVGALPSRERRAAVARLAVADVEDVVVDGRPCLRGVVGGLAPQDLDVVLDTASGLPLRVAPRDGDPVLALRLEELDPRLEDEVFTA